MKRFKHTNIMKKSLFTSAIILSAGALITRIIGGIYKIPLTRILGAEGIGMYQMVFPIFALLIVVSTSGMPMAISKLIAQQSLNYPAKKKILRTCFIYIFIFSVIVSLILCFFSGYIAKFQGNPTLKLSYIAIAPAVILVGILGVFKGYFQGEQMYTPTALSQIIEQSVKVMFGLSTAWLLKPYGLQYQVFGAIMSVSVSELAAVVVIFFQYINYNKRFKNVIIDTKSYQKAIFSTVIPIVLSSVLLPLAGVVDSFLVVNILKKHFSTSTAVAMYGIETGVISSILNIPTIISFSLATVILPSISSEKNESEKKSKISKILSINLAVVLPCVLGFLFFAEPILSILFGKSIVSANLNGLALGKSILTISAIGIFYFSFLQIFSSVLQGIGKAKLAVINLSIAILLKYAIQIPLLFNYNFNIYGLVAGNLLCYLTAFLINYFCVKKYIFTSSKDFSTIFISSIAVIVIIGIGYTLFPSNLGFLITVILGVVLYFYILRSQTTLFDEIRFKHKK